MLNNYIVIKESSINKICDEYAFFVSSNIINVNDLRKPHPIKEVDYELEYPFIIEINGVEIFLRDSEISIIQ